MLYGLVLLVLAGIVFLVIFNIKNGKREKEREARTSEPQSAQAGTRDQEPVVKAEDHVVVKEHIHKPVHEPVQEPNGKPGLEDQRRGEQNPQPGPGLTRNPNAQDYPSKPVVDYDRIAYKSDPHPMSEPEAAPKNTSATRKGGDDHYRQALRQMANPVPDPPQEDERRIAPRSEKDSDQAYREALRNILDRKSAEHSGKGGPD